MYNFKPMNTNGFFTSTLVCAATLAALVLAYPATGSAAAATVGTPAMAAAAPVSADYLIGPGDTLQIFVWRNPDLTITVPVRPDGKISTPLVEDMLAVGKTPTG